MSISNFILGNSEGNPSNSNDFLGVDTPKPIDAIPSVAGEILGLKNKTGMSSDYIAENIDAVRGMASVNPNLPPKAQKFVNQDAAHYPLIKNDIPKLTSLEEKGAFDNYADMLKRTPVAEFATGLYDGWSIDALNSEKLDIYEKIKDEQNGTRTPDQNKKLEELNKKIQEILIDSPSDTGRNVGSVGRQLGKSALITGGTTLALASGGVTATAYPIVVMGTNILMNFLNSYRDSTLSAYADYTQTLDKNNKPMNHDAAKSASEVVGVINGLIETGSDAVLAKIWKPLGKLAGFDETKQFVQKVFNSPNYGKALVDTWKDALKSSGVEGLEEFFQTLVQAGGQEYAQENSGQDFAPVSVESTFKDALMSFKEAAIGTFILSGGLGSSHSIYSTRRDIIQGQKVADHINEISKTINESELKKVSPEKAKEFVDQASDSALYVDAQDFVEYMQSSENDPKQAAKELGISEQDYQAAIDNNSDLKISLGSFIEKIADTEHAQGLYDISRFTEDGLSNKERTQVIQAISDMENEFKTNDKQQTNENQSPLDKVTQSINEVLSSIGMSPAESEANSTLTANTLSYFARNTNTPIEQIIEKYKYRIKKNGKESGFGGGQSKASAPNESINLYQTGEVKKKGKSVLEYSVNNQFKERDNRGRIVFPEDLNQNDFLSFRIEDNEGNSGLHYFKKEDVYKNKELTRLYVDDLHTGADEGIFESKLIDTVYKMDFTEMPKQNFLNQIKKAGIKPGELNYFDIDNLISSLEKDKVSKAELFEKLNGKRPYVDVVQLTKTKVTLSDFDYLVDQYVEKIFENMEELEYEELDAEGLYYFREEYDGEVEIETHDGYESIPYSIGVTVDENGGFVFNDFERNYTLEGKIEPSYLDDEGEKHLTLLDINKVKKLLTAKLYWGRYFDLITFDVIETKYKNYQTKFKGTDYTEEVLLSDPIDRIESDAHFENYSEGQTLHIRHKIVEFKDHNSSNNLLLDQENFEALNNFYNEKAFLLEEIQSDLFNDIQDYSEERINKLLEKKYKKGDFEKDIQTAKAFLNHFNKLDNWVELALKKALISAAESKADIFSMLDENGQNNRWRKKGDERKKFDLIYGVVAKKIIQKFAKKYSEEVEHVYLDNGTREGLYYFKITDKMRQDLLEENTYLFQSDDVNKRGSIRIRDKDFNITLLQDADKSTLMHEFSHSFLKIFSDYENNGNNSEQLNQDIQAIKEVLGVDKLDNIDKRHHEKFAEMFESYLQEGKAPNLNLKRIFEQFKKWLTQIYRKLTKQNIQLDPRLKPIFDRMVEGESELKIQEDAQPQPMFNAESLVAMNMTPKQIENYMRMVADFRAEKLEKSNENLARRLKVLYTKEFKDQVGKITQYTKEELDSNMSARLLAALEKNTLPSGKQISETPLKLNVKDVVKNYPEFYKDIPDRYMNFTGLSVQGMMKLYGFESKEEFFKLLKEKTFQSILDEDSKPQIDSLIQSLEDKYGEMYNSSKIQDEIIDALYTETKADITREEMRMIMQSKPEIYKTLTKKFSLTKQNERVMRAAAREAVNLTAYKDLDPKKFQRAERKNQVQSVKEFYDGNIENALLLKRKALLNHYMVSEVARTKVELDRSVEKLKRFKLGTKQSQIGMSPSFSYHINNLINRFGLVKLPDHYLKQASNEIDYPNLGDFLRYLQDSGKSNLEAIAINPNHLNEKYTQNYKTLPVNELRQLVDTIKQLETIAIQEKKFLSEKENLELQNVLSELTTAIGNYSDKNRDIPLSKASETPKQSALALLRGFDASLLKIERLFIWLDKGRDGPFHKYIWNPLIDAENKEIEYKRKLLEPVYKIVSTHLLENKEVLTQKITVNGMSFNRSEVIMMALNLGNESNKDKLIRGEAIRDRGITEQVINDATSQLTNEEIDLVSSIWKTYESIYPEIENLQRELTGLVPEKIEISPVKIGNRTLQGGYFPVLYDARYSKQAEMQLGTLEGELLEKGYQRATTYKGHTKARVQQFAAPMNLDFAMFPTHLSSVVKDLSHRKWLINMNKIVSNQNFIDAMNQKVGVEYKTLLKEWIKRVINEKNPPDVQMKPWTDSLSTVAANVMTSALGFKLGVVLSQFAGIFPSINELGENGKKYYVSSLSDYFRNPKKQQLFIREKSVQMGDRFDRLNDFYREEILNIRSQQYDFGIESEPLIANFKEAKEKFTKIKELSMVMAGYAESIVSTIAWHAAYTQHMRESTNPDLDQREKEAILKGDSVVRLSQGGRTMKERAAVTTTHDIMKYLTMFYTPFSALYSQLRDMGVTHDTEKNYPKLITKIFLVVVFPSVISEILSGRGPEEPEDPEEWLKFIGSQSATYPFLSVPIARDVVSALGSEYGYQFSPIAQGLSSPLQLASASKKYANDDLTTIEYIGKVLETIGTISGVPFKQAKITGGYWSDIIQGQESPDSFLEFLERSIYRKPKE